MHLESKQFSSTLMKAKLINKRQVMPKLTIVPSFLGNLGQNMSLNMYPRSSARPQNKEFS